MRMGSRAADESAATGGARPGDDGQDDSGSEVDAWASSEDEEGRVTVSVRRSRPPTAHRRAAGGPAATRQRPPHPSRTGVQRGVSSRCDPQRARGDLHKSPPGETRNGDCSQLHSPKRCVSPLRRPLAVVKWYRIDAHWYKPDPAALRSGKQNPNLKRSKRGRVYR